jgi:hypothetical protein
MEAGLDPLVDERHQGVRELISDEKGFVRIGR